MFEEFTESELDTLICAIRKELEYHKGERDKFNIKTHKKEFDFHNKEVDKNASLYTKLLMLRH